MRSSQSQFDYLIAPRIKSAPDVVSNDFQNVAGRVIILGDIHGAAAFSHVLSSLGKDDRLVLVGDLMDDRSTDSNDATFKVLQAIVEWPHKDQIVSVRGNHEEMFLRYMACRRQYQNLNPNIFSALDPVSIFMKNGGKWAEEHTLQELEPIASYVDQLPYIRQASLPQNQQFLVCHADMSMLSDRDVQELLSNRKQLSIQEKATLVWAREDSQAEIHYSDYKSIRNTVSLPVYVGHDITAQGDVPVVREKTNHINLDFGAYAYGPLVGVAHPNKAVVFGDFKENIKPADTQPFFNQLMQLHQKMGAIEFHSIPMLTKYRQFLLESDKKDLRETCQPNLADHDLSNQDSSSGDFSRNVSNNVFDPDSPASSGDFSKAGGGVFEADSSDTDSGPTPRGPR